MAIGDVIAGQSSIAAAGTLDIKPGAGAEWSIHNLFWNQGPVELYKTDGTNAIKFQTKPEAGAILSGVFNVTNGYWLQVKNTAASATVIGYDGRVLK